jgi:hypothetical protein
MRAGFSELHGIGLVNVVVCVCLAQIVVSPRGQRQDKGR